MEGPSTAGYLYVLWHESFAHYGKDVYKLGMTNNPTRRLQGYSPGFLSTVKYLYVSKEFKNCHEAERLLFYVLRDYRLNAHREFFRVAVEKAEAVIKNIEQLSANEIHTLYCRSKANLVPYSTLLRLRGEDDMIEASSSLEYTKGQPVHVFLEQFRYTKQ